MFVVGCKIKIRFFPERFRACNLHVINPSSPNNNLLTFIDLQLELWDSFLFISWFLFRELILPRIAYLRIEIMKEVL